MVRQWIWQRNHTSHKKFYFNEFVANFMRDVIGIVIFDLKGHGGHQRPKTPLRGQKMHEGVNLLKKVFNESCSVTSKTPYRIQSDFSYDLQVERYSMPPCPSHFRHAAASKVCMRLCSYTAAAAGSNILPIQSEGCYLSTVFPHIVSAETILF